MNTKDVLFGIFLASAAWAGTCYLVCDHFEKTIKELSCLHADTHKETIQADALDCLPLSP